MRVVRSVRTRTKARVLGQVQMVRRETYAARDLDTKVERIRSLVPLGLMPVPLLLDEEVEALAGARDARHDGSLGVRHGSNPGTGRVAGPRVPIQGPRVRGARGEWPLRSYAVLQGSRGEVDEGVLRRALYGISCRHDEAAAEAIPGAIGLSSSTGSRAFVHASAAALTVFQERDLRQEDLVAGCLDGKTFAASTLVVALGVRATGETRFLGFVETHTENEVVLTPFLRSLLERGLDLSKGLLVIVDGGKGLRAAVRKACTSRALVPRCQWHTREHVVGDLPKREQATWRRRLPRADDRPTYAEARAALQALYEELEQQNQSAAASRAEGREETRTRHTLGLYGVLGRSLKTTNGIESVNALIEERCAKVDCWKNSRQRHRWLATARLNIEPRLQRVKGHPPRPTLREALQRALKIEAPRIESGEEAA